MAWAGTGLVWTIEAGIPVSSAFAQQPPKSGSGLTFVQIGDSHIGFNKAANTDVTGTLQIAIHRIKALENRPSFILHTGDLTHSARLAEFDTLAETLKDAGRDIFYVPGEHDTAGDHGKCLGRLGPEQIAWLKDDLTVLSNSTPVVVFAHIPLWTVYPQ